MKSRTYIILLIITLIIGISAGYYFHAPVSKDSSENEITEKKGLEYLYACPMLCTVLPEPGDCPVCGMEMQKIEDKPALELTDRAAKLAEVEVAPVERKFVQMPVSLIGEIAYDESRMARITADFPGRIDKLYVDYVGMRVKKGDHMADLFSPELIILQREYQLARDEKTLESVKKKMRSWRFTEDQIDSFKKTGKTIDNITVKAPMGGTVMKKYVLEGDYFKTSDLLFMIADLENLWLILDVYESDLKWLYYGQDIEFDVEAYPGETFKGNLVYIYPDMNRKTRTVKARVNVKNDKGRLKPGMFITAKAFVKIGNKGLPVKPSYAGKWICPMHPEIIRDTKDKCSICGMDLLKAEDIDQIHVADEKQAPPLVIPATAPLITGKRAVVYVEKKPGVYIGKEITIGPKCGDYYVVLDGLEEGEKVVVKGNFKLDSEMQISAKPNMMREEDPGSEIRGPGSGNTEESGPEPVVRDAKKQTICPIMKNPINKDEYVDVKGKRIYVCCPPCKDKIKANPDKYIKEMEKEGIQIEDAP